MKFYLVGKCSVFFLNFVQITRFVMANNYLDTAFVDKAIRFAVDAHAGTERRGKGFPYVIHVLEAMEIVATITSDPELLAAAALHDTIEDTDVTLEQLRTEFTDKVASLVNSESDVLFRPDGVETTWRERKQAAIDRLAGASHDAKVVALGDKLSNMRAIRRDYERVGDELWKIFHAPGGKPDHEWHYRGLAASLSELSDTDAYREFAAAIEEVFKPSSKEEIYSGLIQRLTALLDGETDEIARMANAAAEIHRAFGFWWTGFYRVQDGELILGPFQGPLACMHIGHGRGVCGTAWKENRTVVVPDVEQFPGHIACSSESRSEVVVPVRRGGEVVAVLDIDSEKLATFDDVDALYLGRIVALI